MPSSATVIRCVAAALACTGAWAAAGGGVFTDAADPKLPADFAIQGEYSGGEGAAKVGCQVIALGSGTFQAVVYPGGLPGDGSDGKTKSLLAGKLGEAGKAEFVPAEGKRKYLAQSPDEFSASSTFPPPGHKPHQASIVGDTMTLTPVGGAAIALKKTMRQSPTMGAKPPEGASVLFDGSNKEEWKGGRIDDKTKWLNTDGNDITSKRSFSNYLMHLEFLMPYKPEGRGQGRGNSGFYQILMYEMQILDSFGLDGKNNECGGIYTKAEPKLNMCLPPLSWQSYDVDFTNAVAVDGKKTVNTRFTARLNGVLIHDNLEITGKTGGSRGDPEGTPGPIMLQGHGNPVQFRNIWIVEKK